MSLSYKGNVRGFRDFLLLTPDDIEDILQDTKDAQNYHDAVDRERRMGHTQKALANTYSMRGKVDLIRKKLESHLCRTGSTAS